MPLYELKDIVQAYDGRDVLNIRRWAVEADTVTGVIGPNGSGKSTLLMLLGFVAAPTKGVILFDGLRGEPFADSIRGKVAMLPQDAYLLKRSVYRNVAYGLKKFNCNGDERRRVAEALEMVGLEGEAFASRPWYALSGGEARRVALAARLALQPQVLLMDEPTTSVDAASAQMIKAAALHARQQWGTTLIISSHDTEWLADISDSIVHLFRGELLGSGKQTLIFGPWENSGQGTLKKALTEDQIIQARGSVRDMRTAVAAIEAGRMELFETRGRIPAGMHHLKGQLLRLTYEHATQLTSAAVLIGATVFHVYLPMDEPCAAQFRPGRQVWVGYDPASVHWY